MATARSRNRSSSPGGTLCILVVCVSVLLVGCSAPSLPQSSPTNQDGQPAVSTSDAAMQADALLQRAKTYQDLGLLDRAATELDRCQELAKAAGDPRRIAMATGMLGSLKLSVGDFDQARTLLNESLTVANTYALEPVQATSLANLGLLAALDGRPDEGLDDLTRGLALVERLGDPAMIAGAQINRARAAQMAHRPEPALAALDAAAEAIAALEPSPEKAQLLVAVAASLLRLQDALARSEPSRLRDIEQSLRTAAALAKQVDDQRTLSYAYGHLGRLYETQHRYPEALDWTRQAVALAQRLVAPTLLYQWDWQTGRLLRASGDRNGAIEAYQRAVASLQDVRLRLGQAPDVLGGSFRQTVGPLYMQFADLLLQRAHAASDQRSAQTDLKRAREVIERFKTAELVDYFRDNCVASLQEKVVGIDQMPAGAAALYPILLPDRTELVLTLGDTTHQVVNPVGEADVTEQARLLRDLLVYPSNEYRRPAQRLYQWLIEPIEPLLEAHGIKVLVFIPDGALRTIPVAALYDGHRFLIERYATAVVPGLTLLDPRPISREAIEVLLNALTVARGDFPPLPQVREEVAEIQSRYASTVLLNEGFLINNVEQALEREPFTVVHVASHGMFSPRARESFVLAYDGRITMDQLESFMKLGIFREDPVELLVLSACQTAAGDDQAALGLAGVALKAGARSALASLWWVNDAAAPALVSRFYDGLKTAPTKAEALQAAQLSLLRETPFRHPKHWSAFLLIGNWR